MSQTMTDEVLELRHIMWHVGELNALLRIRGHEQGEW
jgi:hypothetical protein